MLILIITPVLIKECPEKSRPTGCGCQGITVVSYAVGSWGVEFLSQRRSLFKVD